MNLCSSALFSLMCISVATSRNLRCNGPSTGKSDVIFLLDSSATGFTDVEFSRLLGELENFVQQSGMILDSSNVQLALTTVDSFVAGHFQLNTYHNEQLLIDALRRIQKSNTNGATNLYSGFEYILKVNTLHQNGFRSDITEHMIVLITASKSTGVSPLSVVKQIREKFGKGINIVSIGVGHAMDKQELSEISGGSDDCMLIIPDLIKNSQSLTAFLIRKLCEGVAGYCLPGATTIYTTPQITEATTTNSELEPVISECVPSVNTCYNYYTKLSTFDQAETFCAQSGEHMLSIHSQPENDVVVELLMKHNIKRSLLWLGGRGTADGMFAWTDATNFDFTNWNSPGAGAGASDRCIILCGDQFQQCQKGKWMPFPCYSAAAFVCAKPMGPPTTTPTTMTSDTTTSESITRTTWVTTTSDGMSTSEFVTNATSTTITTTPYHNHTVTTTTITPQPSTTTTTTTTDKPIADRCILLLGGGGRHWELEYYHPTSECDRDAIGEMSTQWLADTAWTSGCYLKEENSIVVRESFDYGNKPSIVYQLGGNAAVTQLPLPYNSSDGVLRYVGTSASATLIEGGCVSCGGGYARSSTPGDVEYVDSCYRIDATSSHWQTIAPLPHRLNGAAAVSLTPDRYYVIGGYDGTQSLSQMFMYNASADSWTEARPMPDGRHWHSATALSASELLVCGGRNRRNDCLVYSWTIDQWYSVGNLTVGRMNAALVHFDNDIYALGGLAGDAIDVVEKFDRDTKLWHQVKPLENPRRGFVAVVV